MVRLAAFLVLLSQIILMTLVLDFSGHTAILFSFVGHPLVIAGLGLTGFLVVTRGSNNHD